MGFMENSVLLSVELHAWGIRRKVDAGAVNTDADKEMIAVSKKLIESDAYDAVIREFGKIRQFVDSRTSGDFFIRPGCRFLSLDLVKEMEARLTDARSWVGTLVETFLAEYEDSVTRARRKLGSLFDERNYPSVDKVRPHFSVEWDYLEFHTPGKLGRVAPAALRAAEERLGRAIENAEDNIRQALRGELSGLVDHLRDKLNGLDTGATRRLHETSVTNLTDFLATVRARNITGDQDLISVCDELQAVVKGANVELLKTDETMRARLGQGMDSVKASLATMVEVAPARRIKLEKAA